MGSVDQGNCPPPPIPAASSSRLSALSLLLLPGQRFRLPAEVAGRPGDAAFPGRTGSVAGRTDAPALAKEGGRGRRLGTTSRGGSEASPGGIPSPGQPVRRMVRSVGHPEGFSLLTAGCLTISALGFGEQMSAVLLLSPSSLFSSFFLFFRRTGLVLYYLVMKALLFNRAADALGHLNNFLSRFVFFSPDVPGGFSSPVPPLKCNVPSVCFSI